MCERCQDTDRNGLNILDRQKKRVHVRGTAGGASELLPKDVLVSLCLVLFQRDKEVV